MSFSIRPSHRFPVCCPVTYHAGLSEGHDMIWNLSVNGWRLSGEVPLRVGQTCPLTVTLPDEQRIEIPEAVVRWSRGQELAVENVVIESRTHARLKHYVRRLLQRPADINP